jgi:hypothetical protein
MFPRAWLSSLSLTNSSYWKYTIAAIAPMCMKQRQRYVLMTDNAPDAIDRDQCIDHK